jgi:hypothetical protein
MASKRLEKIKKARSLNDIMDVVNDIAFEFKNSQAVVERLLGSLSAEISFDARGKRPRAKVQDVKFVAPKASDLQKHITVIDKLYANVLELDSAEAMVKQAFVGNKKQPAALKAIAELKASIDPIINDAFDALQEIANKHLPAGMSKFVDDLTSYIIDRLDAKSYKDVFRQVYVTYDPEDKDLLHFSEYIGIENLKTSSGFTFDQYYIVVTGVIDKSGNLTYYVNSFPDFKVPGKYPVGKETPTIDAAKKRVDLLLSHNEFIVIGDKLPMPVTDERAKTSGLSTIKGVKKASVVDDELIINWDRAVIKTDAAKQKMIIDIMARLNAIVNSRASRKIFTYKLDNVARTLTFILVPNVDKSTKHFNLEKLDDAATILDLDEKQKKALRFALQN